MSIKTLSKQQILDSSKLKEFADNNFRYDGSGRKFSKRVENTMGKGEIAHHKQFLLFPQCFQKTCATDKIRACLTQGYIQTALLGLNRIFELIVVD